MSEALDDLQVGEIMTRWPQTIRVFIAAHARCVGCPVSGFHTIADTAREHGLALAEFREAIRRAVASGGLAHGEAVGSAGPNRQQDQPPTI